MKSFLNHYFPWLAKRFPFFQQTKRTIAPINYKKISAAKLRKICAIIDFSGTALNGNHAADYLVPVDESLPPEFTDPLNKVENYINKLGFEEHITLKSDDSQDELKINGVIFENLEITDTVIINFSSLRTVEFVRNKFSRDVEITIIDKTNPNDIDRTPTFPPIEGDDGNLLKDDDGHYVLDFENPFFAPIKKSHVIFDNNKFSTYFKLAVTDIFSVAIKNNDIPNKMDMSFTSTPLPDSSDCHKHQKVDGTQPNELLMKFSNNNVNHLNVFDAKNTLDSRKQDHPLGNIIFDGDNHIGILEIKTEHTTLIPHIQLKVDINRISFKASDKIGISAQGTDSTSDDKKPHFLQDDKYQLTYGRFFSLLETLASKQHNHALEDIYRRKARYFHKNSARRWEDRLIFDWTNLISRDGTSWLRPLLWLTATEALLATIAYCFFVEWDLLKEGGYKIFLTLFVWFMNPASLLPFSTMSLAKGAITNSWLFYSLFLFQKLFVAVFYYEIIKTLRRFTR